MARSKQPLSGVDKAFTLVEMLVAISIIFILLILFTQLFTGISGMIIRQNHQVSSFADTRQALNRFSLDWEARVRHKDIDWFVLDPGKQTISVRLFSKVTGLGGNRGLASVAYQINPITFSLERGTMGYAWTKTGQDPALLFTGTQPLMTPPAPIQANFEVLASTIFRICLSYLDSNTGKWTVTPPASLQDQNVAAIAITTASLDSESRAILSTAQLQNLSTQLGDTSGNQDPKVIWVGKLNSPGFAAAAGIPISAAAAVDIEQRVYSTKN